MSESPQTSGSQPLKLFEAYGVEIEYIIVDRDSLEICPFADKLLMDANGQVVNDLPQGDITWCNELSMHLIEFNFTKPEKTLSGKEELFNKNIAHANSILKKYNAMLLPAGMHPLLKPDAENVKLWPFELSEIFNTYDKIFSCKNHGWINVQSAHLNLPFSGDAEFRKLHSVIRFVLPIIPALAASSPIIEGKIALNMDSRLDHYRNNQSIIPEIGADIIPEIIETPDEYKTIILDKMYKAVSPFDPDGILQSEWLNSRGAIVRFDRSAIEIRVIDTQECVNADFAVLQIISNLIKWIIEEKKEYFNAYHNFNQHQLIGIFNDGIQKADQSFIENMEYLELLNFTSPVSGKELWSRLFDLLYTREEKDAYGLFIREYNANGTLASRIVKAAGKSADKNAIMKIYNELSHCLAENKIFSIL